MPQTNAYSLCKIFTPDQKEKSFQLRKNAEFNNGLRWMDSMKKTVLSKMVTNLTEKSLKESAEILHKKKIQLLREKYLESFLKRMY